LDEFVDYYAILGVTRDASKEAIWRAYELTTSEVRFLDVDDWEKKRILNEIDMAFAVLGDPTRRFAYDTNGSDVVLSSPLSSPTSELKDDWIDIVWIEIVVICVLVAFLNFRSLDLFLIMLPFRALWLFVFTLHAYLWRYIRGQLLRFLDNEILKTASSIGSICAFLAITVYLSLILGSPILGSILFLDPFLSHPSTKNLEWIRLFATIGLLLYLMVVILTKGLKESLIYYKRQKDL
jgi:hypothetical protein